MAAINEAESSSGAQIGSVKAAVTLYGQRVLREKPMQSKTPEEHSEARELHMARRDIDRLTSRRNSAERMKARAESELFKARRTVKDLSLQIEQANAKAQEQRRELQRLKKADRRESQWALTLAESDTSQYREVMRQLESVKQELSQLKLDMASVLESKRQAEKQKSASISKVRSYSSSIKALRKEIEETNEEEVLVELARMEAVQELGAIEAQRQAEAAQYSEKMEKARAKMCNQIEEINHSKELEKSLEIINSDINVLESELKLVRVTGQNMGSDSTDSSNRLNHLLEDIVKRREEKSASESVLESVLSELTEAKKELNSIRQESFQFMTSMDIIREELKHVSEETARLKKLEEKSDSTIQNLNSRHLRAKSKLAAATSAEEKARSIVFNLNATIQQLENEKEAAKREKELISEETSAITQEIRKTQTDTELEEERLRIAMHELESVKKSEARALENLKVLIERTKQERAPSALKNSTIRISNFEYEYLTHRAEEAEEIADKKVAAARAWIEALKASEKEISMKTKLAQRDIRKLRAEEEEELHKIEKALKAGKAVQSELSKRTQKETEEANLGHEVDLIRSPRKDSGGPTTPVRSKARRPSSPGVKRTTSITLRKKKRTVPRLVKFFAGIKAGKQT